MHVEAELGTLGGIEDLGETAARSMLTDPDQAVRFADETGVDALAIAIGTSHGAYKFKGTPHLDLERLQGDRRAHPAADRAARRVVAAARTRSRSPSATARSCRTRRASRRS